MYDNLILGIHTMSIWFGLKTGCDNEPPQASTGGEACLTTVFGIQLVSQISILDSI
jgi:hypothetical protein